MNKVDYEKQLQEAIKPTYSMNVELMAEWFEWTLQRLEAEGQQSKTITHPGIKGEKCEDLLREILREMMPLSISQSPGFLTHRLGGVSKEQDIIMFDAKRAINLRPGGKAKYLPLEAGLASLEVKSDLNVATTRDAVLNCISAKRLYQQTGGIILEPENDRELMYCYGIFAYRSRHSIKTIENQLNEAVKNVPYRLRPNIVYVLGKGMLLPSNKKEMNFTTDQMFEEGDFRSVDWMATPTLMRWKKVYPFLWFVSNIVDFCIEEQERRTAPKYLEYWLVSFDLQARVDQLPKKDKK